ncbi:MAG TPA: RNase adapter RapZ [Bacillota bacterium]|nr:RNase adapter RapZ [Bacillota bacterium]HPZ41144.1 RNase adapter RapZ [Bacillota bacterium]HQD52643.1 RNase adapter RapZ [Bacillota bacterium]
MVQKDALQIVLITGLSGAGKSHAINCFEDLGFFCVDNLPPTFILKFAELCLQSEGKISKIALVCDMRGGAFFDHLFEALHELEENEINHEILFLEASDEVLLRRYKETRRRHPLSDMGLLEAIQAERLALGELRGKADKIIDTSLLAPRDLKKKIFEIYEPGQRERGMPVLLVSFGFKYGMPLDADLVFDVRFLPNPHYVEHLRSLTGKDARVKDYLWRWMVTHKYFQKLQDLLEFSIPYYIREGKVQLVVSIGCTGGKHRSVALADELGRVLSNRYRVHIEHRDIDKA